jgi:hypothetical protein
MIGGYGRPAPPLSWRGLADREPEKYERAGGRWHARFLQEVPNIELRESHAVLGLLAAVPVNRLAASALRAPEPPAARDERIAEALVSWSRRRSR